MSRLQGLTFEEQTQNYLLSMSLDLQKLRETVLEQKGLSVLSEGKISEAERQLGFTLPPPLRRLYLEISGGSFGPGYGFYGLIEGTELFPNETVVSLYAAFRRGDPDDPSFSWPHMLLPILDWGCAIRSCLDCSVPFLPMIRFDPNSEGPVQFQSENFTFEEWIQAWLDGYDLWELKAIDP